MDSSLWENPLAGLINNKKGDSLDSIMRWIQPNKRVVVAQGYGLRPDPLPLRCLAYAAAAVRLVLQLLKQIPDIQPTLELYIARNGVLRANSDYPRETIERKGWFLYNRFATYIGERYPALQHRTELLFDSSIVSGSRLDQYLRSLRPVAETIASQSPALSSFITSRGGRRALAYFLEHGLYMDDPWTGTDKLAGLLLYGRVRPLDVKIMVGGRPEQIFYDFRQAIARTIGLHDAWQSFQVFVNAGDPPAYHYQRGEPTWSDFHSLPLSAIQMLYQVARQVGELSPTFVTGVVRDLITLLLDFGEAPDLTWLRQIEKAIKTGGVIDSTTEQCLQAGWDSLKRLYPARRY